MDKSEFCFSKESATGQEKISSGCLEQVVLLLDKWKSRLQDEQHSESKTWTNLKS